VDKKKGRILLKEREKTSPEEERCSEGRYCRGLLLGGGHFQEEISFIGGTHSENMGKKGVLENDPKKPERRRRGECRALEKKGNKRHRPIPSARPIEGGRVSVLCQEGE